MVNIDNTIDCFAFVKAAHKNSDVALVITATILELNKKGISPFFDYILSEENIADWASRQDLLFMFNLVEGVKFRNPTNVGETLNPQSWMKMLRAAGIDLDVPDDSKFSLDIDEFDEIMVENEGSKRKEIQNPFAWAMSLPDFK